MFSLKGKNAVVTGAGSGIGKAAALLFAQQQAMVHLLDLNQDAIDAVANEISNSKGSAIAHKCDVSQQKEVKNIFAGLKKIDILVTAQVFRI